MRKDVLGLSLFVLLTSFVPAFGVGLRCATDDDLTVYLFEQGGPQQTQEQHVPAALVITSKAQGTVLVRHGREITEEALSDGLFQYSTNANEKLNADTAVVRVHARLAEEEKAAGVTAKGQLILLTDDERSILQLVCYRD